jgi:hypothetical protein
MKEEKKLENKKEQREKLFRKKAFLANFKS